MFEVLLTKGADVHATTLVSGVKLNA
jgi:hypothetical protein